jgi:hypothetical protein
VGAASLSVDDQLFIMRITKENEELKHALIKIMILSEDAANYNIVIQEILEIAKSVLK